MYVEVSSREVAATSCRAQGFFRARLGPARPPARRTDFGESPTQQQLKVGRTLGQYVHECGHTTHRGGTFGSFCAVPTFNALVGISGFYLELCTNRKVRGRVLAIVPPRHAGAADTRIAFEL